MSCPCVYKCAPVSPSSLAPCAFSFPVSSATMKPLLLALALATGVSACQRDITTSTPHRHAKRQGTRAAFPPVLDANERTLVNSFDNTSISTWSYYYAHSYHLAGTNKTIAQWTADRWAENGFASRLDEYCRSDPIRNPVLSNRPSCLPELSSLALAPSHLSQRHYFPPTT